MIFASRRPSRLRGYHLLGRCTQRSNSGRGEVRYFLLQPVVESIRRRLLSVIDARDTPASSLHNLSTVDMLVEEAPSCVIYGVKPLAHCVEGGTYAYSTCMRDDPSTAATRTHVEDLHVPAEFPWKERLGHTPGPVPFDEMTIRQAVLHAHFADFSRCFESMDVTPCPASFVYCCTDLALGGDVKVERTRSPKYIRCQNQVGGSENQQLDSQSIQCTRSVSWSPG